MEKEESGFVREVTRKVSVPVQNLLWGRSAARCEFSGHNRPLWKSSVTQETVNVAQKAHIYAFSEGGPRFDHAVSDDEINSLENLLLVCHECHEKIDAHSDGGRYPASLLRTWKREHEDRVERVTGIAPGKQSHILLYGANIGAYNAPLSYAPAAEAMFPERYPAEDAAIELGTINSSFLDRDGEFWRIEAENLRRKFKASVLEPLALRRIQHTSVFALAPQPLLILLGTLLPDLLESDVYQRHREPQQSWSWPSDPIGQRFEVVRHVKEGPPALVLAISANVTLDRIYDVLGADASIWLLTVPSPHNDVLKSRGQLSEIRTLLRQVINEIKATHGQTTALHVFPAAPNSVNIELGRVRMPKADMPWHVYDQNNERGGFVPALTIPEGDK